MSSDKSSYGLVPGPLTLTLLRHGHSSWTREGRSVDDPVLTELGCHQAAILAKRLRSERFDRVLVSPMRRATQTADLAGLGDRDDAATVDWLGEIRYPSWAGEPAQVAAQALVDMRQLPVAERWRAFGDEGEAIDAFVERVRGGLLSFLAGLGVRPVRRDGVFLWEATDPAPSHVLLLGHAGSLATVIATVMGLEPVPWEWERFQLAYCSLTRLVSFPVGTDLSFSVERLSDVDHLDGNLRSW
jgi:broad specificity phosphatase PhoE